MLYVDWIAARNFKKSQTDSKYPTASWCYSMFMDQWWDDSRTFDSNSDSDSLIVVRFQFRFRFRFQNKNYVFDSDSTRVGSDFGICNRSIPIPILGRVDSNSDSNWKFTSRLEPESTFIWDWSNSYIWIPRTWKLILDSVLVELNSYTYSLLIRESTASCLKVTALTKTWHIRPLSVYTNFIIRRQGPILITGFMIILHNFNLVRLYN